MRRCKKKEKIEIKTVACPDSIVTKNEKDFSILGVREECTTFIRRNCFWNVFFYIYTFILFMCTSIGMDVRSCILLHAFFILFFMCTNSNKQYVDYFCPCLGFTGLLFLYCSSFYSYCTFFHRIAAVDAGIFEYLRFFFFLTFFPLPLSFSTYTFISFIILFFYSLQRTIYIYMYISRSI